MRVPLDTLIDFLVMASYFAGLILVGRWTARRVRSAEDFHLCGRSLGRLPTMLSDDRHLRSPAGPLRGGPAHQGAVRVFGRLSREAP